MDFGLREEERLLQERVRRFVNEKIMPMVPQIEETYHIPWDVAKLLAEQGLFGLLIPEEYGGSIKGGKPQALPLCLIGEELSRGSAIASAMFGNTVLGGYTLTLAGSEEVKRDYLPPIARGEKLAAFAITELDAGSDAGALKTSAVLDGNEYVLNGTKWFVPPEMQTYVVFAKTDPTKGSKGVSAFLVESPTPGLEIRDMGGLLAGTEPMGEFIFTECRIPKRNLLGEPEGGFKIGLTTLSVSRVIIAAGAIGQAQRAFELALDYAKQRVQFGQPIANYQLIQAYLAEMALDIQAARLLVYYVCWLHDQGFPRIVKESAMAKLFATEAAIRVADKALRIYGGYGVLKSRPIEGIFRRTRDNVIVEGTSEMLILNIARELLRA